MSSKTDIESGLTQMNFEIVDNGVLKLPSSKPATYTFVGEPTPDINLLEKELDSHDFGLWSTNCETKNDGRFYCHFELVTDHYKRVKVKTWNDRVCIFPREELPDRFEFSRIVHTIENAFDSEIEHNEEHP